MNVILKTEIPPSPPRFPPIDRPAAAPIVTFTSISLSGEKICIILAPMFALALAVNGPEVAKSL